MKKILHLSILFIFNFLTFSVNAQVTDLAETFDNPFLPSGWETQNIGSNISERWNISGTAKAGGSAYELVCNWQSINPGTTRVIAPAINTTGLTTLNLNFKHFFDDWAMGATLRIQTSTDKVTWANEAWIASSGMGDIGPQSVNTIITNNLNSSTTFIAFVIEGNLYNFDNWFIDDVFTSSNLSAPVIQVNSPKTGSFWAQGSEHEISWMSMNVGDPVNLEYSTDGGTLWTPIINEIIPVNGNNSYFWTIPAVTGVQNNSMVRVKTASGEIIGNSNIFTLSESPQFTIQAPTTGTQLTAGQTHELNINNIGSYTNVFGYMNLSVDGGVTWDQLFYLYEFFPGINSFSFDLDPFIQGSANCKLAFFAYDITSQVYFESELFEIISAPASITVNQPVGGSFWTSGTERFIEWTSINISQTLTIEYSLDGVSNWTTIVSDYYATQGDYSYSWIVPNVPGINPNSVIRITTGGSVSGISSPFTISSSPQFTFLQPAAGAALTAGQVFNLEINNIGSESSYKYLYLSFDGNLIFIDALEIPAGISQHEWAIDPSINTNQAILNLFDPNTGEWSSPSELFEISPAPSSITVNKPIAGEYWRSGTIKNIEWTSVNVSQNINIDYSLDGGSSWINIVQDYPTYNGWNSYSWTVNSIGNSYNNSLMRIVTNDAGATVSTISNIFTLAETPQIVFDQPAAGAEITKWTAGQTYQVELNNQGNNSDYPVFYVYLSTDGGLNWNYYLFEIYDLIPAGLSQYSWTIDPVMATSSAKLIIYNPYTGDIIESPLFEILPEPPGITISQPTAGVYLHSGKQVYLEWSTNVEQYVKIEYSLNGGPWITDVTGIYSYSGYNSYMWTVPGVSGLNANSMLRVVSDDGTISGNSEILTISETPQLTIDLPSTGTEWAIGQSYPITINNLGPYSVVNGYIVLSTNGGASWDYWFQYIAELNPGINTFMWNTSGYPLSPTCKLAIIPGWGYDPGWQYFSESGTFTLKDFVPVSQISISSDGGATSIDVEGGMLQLYASVLPADASNQTIHWSVTDLTGRATISQTGLLTANLDGIVNVTATSTDGYYITANQQIIISNQIDTPDDYNIIKDGGFATDGAIGGAWNVWSDNGGTAQIISGVCTMTPAAASYNWALQVHQPDLDVANGSSYVLSFTAWAEADRIFSVVLQDMNNGYTPIGSSTDPESFGRSSWNISLTTTPTTYTFHTTLDAVQLNSNNQITFLGSEATDIIYLDDVSLINEIFGPASISVTSPVAGSFLHSGSQQIIEWNSVNVYQNVNFQYSINGGGSWTDVAGQYPVNGYNSYLWTVADVSGLQNNALVRVISDDNSVIGVSNVFTISETPQFIIDQPTTGTEWAVDQSYPITINNIGPYAYLNGYIVLSINDGASWDYLWQYVPELYPGINIIMWNTSGYPVSANCKLAIVPNWGYDPNWQYFSESGTFSLNALVPVSSISILPEGGATSIDTEAGTLQMNAEVLPANASTQAIHWTVTDVSGRAVINSSGLLTAFINGTVIVNAYATDGSETSSSMVITITNQTEAPEDYNIIKDGGFATDGPVSGFWETWSSNGGTAEITGGVCKMVPAAIGSTWELLVAQRGWTGITNGSSYILTFTAWSEVNRSMQLSVEDHPGNNYRRLGNSNDPESNGRSDWWIPLTPTPTTFTLHFTVDSLLMNSYNNLVLTTSSELGTVFIDDISIKNSIFGPFGGGTGTESDPYLIETAEQLNNIRLFLGPTNANIHFLQTADIDLGVSPWNDGEGWSPIGDASVQFFGKYNGNGFTISGLTINRPEHTNIGLFGRSVGASFTNIGLVNVDIIGGSRVGALSGFMNGCYVNNCYSTGNLKGQLFPAGLVGNFYYGSVMENCYSTVNVQMVTGAGTIGNQQAGGLVARLSFNSSIYNSFATGNVEGIAMNTGGLVSLVTDNSLVQNCYSTGQVTGTSAVGGLIGGLSIGSFVINSYSVGKVIYSDQGGGLIGTFNNDGSGVANSYWNTETTSQANSSAGEGRNTLDMITSSTFSAWDFASIWSIYEGSSYPFLQNQGSADLFNYPPENLPPSNLTGIADNGSISLTWQAPSLGSPTEYFIYRDGILYTSVSSAFLSFVDNSVTNYVTYTYNITADYSGIESPLSNEVSIFPQTGFSGGDGSAGNPFLVSNAGELFTVRLYPASYFRQIADIDLGVAPWSASEGWDPIGSLGSPFNGFYDGDGYSINNLTINRPARQAVGLFGSINVSIIKNVNLVNAYVNGFEYVGALVGDVNNSKLINNSTDGSVSAQKTVGGIAGGLYFSELNKSHSSGTVSAAGNWAGGITGQNYSSLINNSYSMANISVLGFTAGGLVGTNENRSAISNSYFLGSVSGPEFVGGIAGWLDNSLVNVCYSTGTVSGSGSVGGLIGAGAANSEVVSNSYWNTETSGQATSQGGEGRITSEMTYPYNLNTYTGWDFGFIWAHDTEGSVNNGYPFLQMLNVDLPSVTTLNPDFITATAAFVPANVTADGGVPVTERGICWSTVNNPTVFNPHFSHWSTGTGSYSITITGLLAETTYFVRAYATNSVGTSYGEEYSFTTSALDPSTVVFSIIGGNAYYDNDGELSWWSIDGIDDLDLTYIGEIDGKSAYQISSLELLQNGEFKIRKDHQWYESYGYDEVTITGDPSNFVKEYVNIKTLIGKAYEITFYVDWVNNNYTLSLIQLSPTIITANVTSVTSNSAVSGGEVIAEGVNPVVESGVVWGTNPNPLVSDNFNSEASGAGAYISNLTGLVPQTSYFVRAFAKTSVGAYFYGNEYIFTTLNSDATITSIDYSIDQETFSINNVSLSESLVSFKGKLIPATDAVFEVYQGDGNTVASDLQTGYLVIVTAEDGTVKTYTININAAASDKAILISYKIAGIEATIDTVAKTVTATLPFGSNVTNLVATFTMSGGASASISGTPQVSGVNINDFTSPVIYDITAEDATTVINWTVSISVTPASSVATVSSTVYTVDNTLNTIVNIPATESLATFKSKLIPATGAAFEVYKSDGIIVATDLQSGYKVVVTAQNGSTNKTYTITLNSAGSNLAEFLVFKVAGKNGIINSTSKLITVNLPFGSVVTNLAASFIISDGASAKVGSTVQVNNVTTNNFTNPVVYNVTAENGTTVVSWTVTVNVAAPSTLATVSSTAYAVINASGIIMNVPDSESLAVFKSKLTPAAGATFEVYQSDGNTVATDLQKGYKVIVTAQDGTTTKTYLIASSQTDFITFSITGVNATIHTATNTVTATLPYGTSVTNLVATFSISSGASAKIAGVVQESGVTTNDFTGSLIYDLTAQDGITTESWTVTITVTPASTDASLSSTVYTINNSAKTIADVPFTESLAAFRSNLTPAAYASFEVYTTDELTVATDLQTGYKVIVVAQDGSTATYVITLNAAASSEASFITFSAASVNATINSGTQSVTATLPIGTDVSNLTATFSISVGASVKVGGVAQVSGITANNFTSPVIYDITAEDGTVVSWTVTLTVTTLSSDATVSSSVYIVNNSTETITSVPITETLAVFKSNIVPATNATFEVYEIDGTTIATDLQTGYMVIATAQNGTTTKSYTIELSAAGIAGSNTTICSGSTASLTLTGYSGTIQWQQSADGLSGWTNVTGGTGETTANYTTANLTSTTYYRAEVTDSPNVVYSNVVIVAMAPAVGDAGVISGSESVCKGQSAVIYTVPEIENATSYNWVLPTGVTGASTTNSISVEIGLSFVSGGIEVSGLNSCNTGGASIIFVAVNLAPATAGTISGASTVCQGEGPVTYTVPAITNATSYIWTLPAGATGTSTTNTINVNYGATATSGSITVKGSNICGEGTASSLSVLVNQLPANPGTISGSATVCQGDNSKSYAVPTIARATSYVWTLPDGASGTSSTNIITVSYSTSAVPGNLVVRGQNACGVGADRTLAITVNPLPAIAGKITGPEIICEGQDTGTYNVPAISNATSYLWTLPSGITGTSTTSSITVNYSGSFTSGGIEVYGQNSCGTGDPSIIVVTVFAVPEQPEITPSGSTTFCADNSVDLSAPVSASYLWSNGETTRNISVSTTGSYTVKVSNGTCQSIASEAVNVTVNPIPATPVVTPAGTTIFCAGESVDLSAPNSVSYLWSTGETTQSINVVTTGSYTVQVGDGICQSLSSEPIVVTVNPFPVSAGGISGTASICGVPSSETYTVPDITHATEYIWTLPDGATGISTTNSIVVSYGVLFVSGNITVRGNNSCGNGAESVIEVAVSPPLANAGTITGPATVCPGDISVSYTVPAVDNATSYVWTLSEGITGTSLTNSIDLAFSEVFVSGSIKVFGQNACSTGDESTFTISANPQTASAGAISGSVNVCQGENSVTYTVSDIGNAESYIWTLPGGVSGTSTTNSITVDYGTSAVSGDITVKGNNICGNGDASTLAIIVNPLPAGAGSIGGLPTTVCQGVSNVTYTATPVDNADSYIWTLPSGVSGSSSTNAITVNYTATAISGNITWKGHNSCGDGIAGTLPITVNPLPADAGAISGETSVCEGPTTESYTVPVIDNTTSYMWTLPTGATGTSTTNTISVNFALSFASGNIEVYGLNDCGFGGTSSVAVSVMPKPASAGAISGPAAACVGENSITYTVPPIDNVTSYVWTLPVGLTGTSTTNSIDLDFVSSFDLDLIEVYGKNSCYNGTPSSMQIKSSLVPLGAGAISGPTTVCLNQNSVVYNVATITNAAEYIWTLPDGATGTMSSGGKIITVNFGPTAVSGIISVKGHNTCDGPSSSLDITVKYPYQEEQICLVTIDTATGKNMVVWEKTKDVDILSYNIYRETTTGDVYSFVDNVSADSLSVYVDMNSDPEAYAHKFYITAVDNCGNESEPSEWHKTMLLTSSIGTGESNVNLAWSEYKKGTIGSLGSSFLFTSYIIYRSTSTDNNMEAIATLPSDNTLYVDKTAPRGVNLYYRIAGVKAEPCDPADLLGKKASSGPFVHSLSNLEDNRIQNTGITNPIADALQLSVYPSPFTYETTISYALENQSRMKVEIFNVVGEKIKVLLDENQSAGSYKLEMNASDVNYYPGIYYLKIFVNDDVVIRKTMLTR